MNAPLPRNVIVAAVDRTAATAQVVYTATSLARMIAGSELHLVHVVEAGAPPGAIPTPLANTLEDTRVFLADLEARVAERFEGRVGSHVGVDLPARHVVQLASDLEADLIVVGSHGKGGLARLLLGSVSQYVVNNAPCAVLVARPKSDVAVPDIEPPCPTCREVQKTTGGDTLWCTQHAGRRAKARTHYETPEPFALGSMFLRPDA